VISGGKVIERGSHEELLAKNGVYRRLWDDQSHTPHAADQPGATDDDDEDEEDEEN
jgi:ATP-binding cassette, subfamily B, bacterial